jgi:hypothetical protein
MHKNTIRSRLESAISRTRGQCPPAAVGYHVVFLVRLGLDRVQSHILMTALTRYASTGKQVDVEIT